MEVMHGKVTDSEKALGAIAYLGPLFIVSYLAANGSKFVKFHAAQGLVLFIAAIVLRVAMGLLYMVMYSGSSYGYGYGMMGMMWGGGGLMMIVNLVMFILAIVGIIKAIQSEMWEMPVLGAWAKKIVG
ncbi:DUF4870 domain-containing protein [Candidatus Uhrbacteria bacterium]|nr:DUF4870 domain-containing protein [Candidatus Uhrbacteria bacterium]